LLNQKNRITLEKHSTMKNSTKNSFLGVIEEIIAAAIIISLGFTISAIIFGII
jgi:hypothetical protein